MQEIQICDTTLVQVVKSEKSDEIKYLHVSDIMTLISAEDSKFWKMVFLFMFETGCRITEGMNVKFDDVMFYENKVKVMTLKQRKPSFRILKLSSELTKLLMLHKTENYMNNSDYIFSKKSGKKQISNPAIWYRLRKLIRRTLGESKESFGHSHMFRHSRAIHLLSTGMNIVLLQKFLGHKSINNTLIYLKYHNEELFNSIDQSNSTMDLF
ncbi:MAG: tyrosine-type recombinase/integrase [Deferribacterales bacterium]